MMAWATMATKTSAVLLIAPIVFAVLKQNAYHEDTKTQSREKKNLRVFVTDQ